MPRVPRPESRYEVTSTPMLRHYLFMALRSFARHKLYSFINVFGLSVALTCVILVILFVRYQLSYDTWIPGTERLYRAELTLPIPGAPSLNSATTPNALGPAMRRQIPGVNGVTRLISRSLTLTHGGRQFLEENVDFVDPNFFRLIRLPFIEGDVDSVLSQPESVVLSQSAARRYFGNSDPMGQTLTASVGSCPKQAAACGGETVSLRVTGIVRDLPQNTQLAGNVFIPIASLADPFSSTARQSWRSFGSYTYISLAPAVEPAAVLAVMPSILDQDVAGPMRKLMAIHLTPFAEVHLQSSRWSWNLTPPGNWSTVYGVIIIGMLILLVACFNFMNLATARASLRAREIGLRKTAGATRGQLTVQFLSEAVCLALLSLVFAVAAAEMLLPAFDGFLHQSIALEYARDWRLDLMLVGVAITAGLLSGIYPALVLSRLRPVAALQAESGSVKTLVGLRGLLVLLQFAVSIGLGIGAMIVFRQMDYVRGMNLGFRWDDIVIIRNGNLMGDRQEAFAQALRANPGVREVGLSAISPFSSERGIAQIEMPGHPNLPTFSEVPIDPNYPRTYGIALVAGRLFSAARADDGVDGITTTGPQGNMLVNVTGARMLGFTPKGVVGKTVVWGKTRLRIVGVLGDTKMHGAFEPVAPTLYTYSPGMPMDFVVRLRPKQIAQTLAFIDRTWHAFEPTVAIRRSFLSERFASLYRSDERQGTVFCVLVVIAIFIACLGLYGLVVFTADRRTKEVAVRKISGADTRAIMKLMLWRISVPVLLANAIAWPVAYYFLQRWLQGFADHIRLDPMYFLMSGAIALLIAWATVFVHTVRLARTSPIRALRYQ
jgi:putative ABC transport system permease protein